MKKLLFMILLIVIVCGTAFAGDPPLETRSSGLKTSSSGAIDTQDGRLWSVHGRATGNTATLRVYDETNDTATATKCLATFGQATSGGYIGGVLHGVRYWSGLYSIMTNCEATFEMDMK